MGTTSNKVPVPGSDHRTFLFGKFVLDIDRGALLKDGADVPLRPQCFKVLCYLVEHNGLLVTKEELLGAVWGDVVVTEDSLTQCLIQIRKALGDHSREMIRTIPRRGFLFEMQVTVHKPGEMMQEPVEDSSFVSNRRPSRWSVGAAIVLAMAIAATWWNTQRQEHEHPAPDYNRTEALPTSIAALPFVNMSPEKDQQLFADGMSEEVLKFKLLGEAHAGDSVTDPAFIPDAKAWEHYLKGKFFYSRRGTGDNELAIRHYWQALNIDPDLADAWAGLAGSINLQSYNLEIPKEQGRALIKATLDRALTLEPNHAEAHSRLARYYSCIGEPDLGQQHLDLALKYGQNSPLVQSIVAGNAYSAGSYAEAIKLQRRAVALDPLGFVNRGNLAGFLYSAGRFEEARLEYHNALELNPEKVGEINWRLALVHILLQQYEEALLLVQQIPDGLAKDQVQAMIHHGLQGPNDSNTALARLLADSGIEAAVYLVDVYSFLNDFDEAFQWLSLATDKILETKSSYYEDEYLNQMWNSPFLVPLHDKPRWASWEAGIDIEYPEDQIRQRQAN